jgi:hypothetical protein
VDAIWVLCCTKIAKYPGRNLEILIYLSIIDCGFVSTVQNGRVEFASGTGTVETMILCDDGFVSPPGPALCRTRVTPTGEVGVVREGEVACLQPENRCGESCYISIIVCGILLLLLLLLVFVLVLVIYCCYCLPHTYNVTPGKSITHSKFSFLLLIIGEL